MTIAAAPPVLEPVDEAAFAALAAIDDAEAAAPEEILPVLVTRPEPVTTVEDPCVLVRPPVTTLSVFCEESVLVAAALALEAEAEANKLALLALLLVSML